MERLDIAIVGLGLVGGSLGLDLAGWSRKGIIRGYDRDPAVCSVAQKKGVVDVVFDFQNTIEGADLIFLATPVRAIPEIFLRMKPFLKKNALIFDLGSVKEWTLQQIGQQISPWEYIGFHPMGGKEQGGIKHAQRGLFQGVPILVVPPHLQDNTRDLVWEIAQVLGGRVFF